MDELTNNIGTCAKCGKIAETQDSLCFECFIHSESTQESNASIQKSFVASGCLPMLLFIFGFLCIAISIFMFFILVTCKFKFHFE